MIIGERFAWGHLPKTGGDATHAMLTEVFPDLVVEADPVRAMPDRSKHDPFPARGPEVTSKPMLVLNIRRLPARQLSMAQHLYRNGEPPYYKPMPMRTPEEVSSTTRPDELLDHFTDGGRLRITHWLRMEHLREDLLAFVAELRGVTPQERKRVLSMRTPKQYVPYDHDVHRFFSKEQIARLYEHNPVWADVERRMYGGLVGELTDGSGR